MSWIKTGNYNYVTNHLIRGLVTKTVLCLLVENQLRIRRAILELVFPAEQFESNLYRVQQVDFRPGLHRHPIALVTLIDDRENKKKIRINLSVRS